jgi:hypothetical protein
MDAIDGNFNPFWMFEENGNASISLPTNITTVDVGGESESLIESLHIPENLMNFGLGAVAKNALRKFFDFAAKLYAKFLVKSFLEYLYFQDEKMRAKLVPEITFDLIVVSYVWSMLHVNGKNRGNRTKIAIKGLFKSITEKEQPYRNWFYNYPAWCGYFHCEAFKIVPLIISSRIISFLTNCFVPFRFISREEYERCLDRFVLTKHTQYERLVTPNNHPLAVNSVLKLVSSPRVSDTNRYFRSRYEHHQYIADNEKNFKNFLKNIEDMPTGKDSFY